MGSNRSIVNRDEQKRPPMNVKDLRKEAKRLKLVGYSKLRKEGLVLLIAEEKERLIDEAHEDEQTPVLSFKVDVVCSECHCDEISIHKRDRWCSWCGSEELIPKNGFQLAVSRALALVEKAIVSLGNPLHRAGDYMTALRSCQSVVSYRVKRTRRTTI